MKVITSHLRLHKNQMIHRIMHKRIVPSLVMLTTTMILSIEKVKTQTLIKCFVFGQTSIHDCMYITLIVLIRQKIRISYNRFYTPN